MTIFEIGKLKNSLGECVAVSSFFSTTMDRQIADIFAGDGSNNDSYVVSVIFKIYLYPGQPMRPYALINNSAEEEVLLSPGTKFVLIACQKLCHDGQLWFIALDAIPEQQQQELLLIHGQTLLLSSEASEWTTAGPRITEQYQNRCLPFTKTLFVASFYFKARLSVSKK
jgi:hypothetical protein